MTEPNLITFDTLAGVKCYWARTNEAYGNVSKALKGKRKLNPTFKKLLEVCLTELWWCCPYGKAEAITSGGAYVDKAGRHSTGRAFDLGGIHWDDYILTTLYVASVDKCKDDSKALKLYLGVESILRRYFGTVLGVHYNKAHENHWHIDSGSKVGYWSKGFGSTTRVTYLQEVLREVWSFNCVTDGKAGPQTNSNIRLVRDMLHLGPFTNQDNWKQFLLLTGLQAMQSSCT